MGENGSRLQEKPGAESAEMDKGATICAKIDAASAFVSGSAQITASSSVI